MNLRNRLFSLAIALSATALFSCSTQARLGKLARTSLLSKQELAPAHIGITIADASTGKYLYNHNGEKLFVPASNTKLFTCYASLKYLGDSLAGARYSILDSTLFIQATGDPTFLHPDFKQQPLFNFMQQPRFNEVKLHTAFAAKPLGRGWAWDDYPSDYMAERDPFPMYGNVATFTLVGSELSSIPHRLPVVGKPVAGQAWDITRNLGGRFYLVQNNRGTTAPQKTITMAMESGSFASRYLQDTLHKEVFTLETPLPRQTTAVLYSQPTDSVLSLMMHRSDNFIAEQLLLMAGDALTGEMNERAVIDTLLKTDLKNLPQAPKWVDGSGLSRYNLFSPQDFIWVLQQMKNEYGFERMQLLLPTGKTGTLSSLYHKYTGRIFAKTGTLSNNLALSGYVITKQNKTLLFSVLVNNHQSSPATIRTMIEAFMSGVIEKW